MELAISTMKTQTGLIGLITLQREQAYNALSYDMIKAIRKALDDWAVDADIHAVMIRSNHPKAFCAGGDIRELYHYIQTQDSQMLDFFRDEYALNHAIYHYPKPYIALLDGITMGGGVGVSMHGSHIIATEHLKFAMPETTIGFYPDIGGSYLLAQAPGECGTYLALTGNAIGLADSVYCGIVTHHLKRATISDFCEQLKTDPLDKALEQYTQPAPEATLAKLQMQIDQHFQFNTVQSILDSLAKDPSEFAVATLKTLQQKSPTSLTLTLQLMRKAFTKSFDEIIALDNKLVKYFLQSHDFPEGIRALLIDKDKNPQWNPNTLAAVALPAALLDG